jgi:hypothetical protein
MVTNGIHFAECICKTHTARAVQTTNAAIINAALTCGGQCPSPQRRFINWTAIPKHDIKIEKSIAKT